MSLYYQDDRVTLYHGAVAVMAGTRDLDSPRVFVKDGDGIWNDALSGRGYSPDALHDVTPLIEAKVTDEMVIRARGSLRRATGYDYAYATVQDALTAALGLDPYREQES